MKFVFTICNVILAFELLAGFSVSEKKASFDSVRSEKREGQLYIIHKVEEKETLYSLAKRYRSSVQQISADNRLENNTIDIGQVIAIKVLKTEPDKLEDTIAAASDTKIDDESINDMEGFHQVEKGETLYSLSRKYDVKVKELKRWNELQGNDISEGALLKVSKIASRKEAPQELVAEKKEKKEKPKKLKPAKGIEIGHDEDPYEGFSKYLVQTGETLYTIASKLEREVDSLRFWNQLTSSQLKIGQTLYYRTQKRLASTKVDAIKSKKRAQIDSDGFERIFQEGIASVISEMKTSKFLALHSSLPVGTDLEVRNLMNNRVVHVKVAGKLPDTGVNQNLLLRLSQPAFDQLGILDAKTRVEVSYLKN